jgi:hypothetical protein
MKGRWKNVADFLELHPGDYIRARREHMHTSSWVAIGKVLRIYGHRELEINGWLIQSYAIVQKLIIER